MQRAIALFPPSRSSSPGQHPHHTRHCISPKKSHCSSRRALVRSPVAAKTSDGRSYLRGWLQLACAIPSSQQCRSLLAGVSIPASDYVVCSFLVAARRRPIAATPLSIVAHSGTRCGLPTCPSKHPKRYRLPLAVMPVAAFTSRRLHLAAEPSQLAVMPDAALPSRRL